MIFWPLDLVKNFFPKEKVLNLCHRDRAFPKGGGGTQVGFGWVCAAQASKCGPHFRNDLQPKRHPVLKNMQVL